MQRISFYRPTSSKLPVRGKHTRTPGRGKQTPSRFSRIRKPSRRMVVISLALFVVVYVFLLHPVVAVYANVRSARAHGKNIAAHLKEQDFEAIQDDLNDLEDDFRDLNGVANRYHYLRILPGTSVYFDDAPHLTQAAIHGVGMMRLGFTAVEPYKELLGLAPESEGEDVAATNKLVTALRVFPKLAPEFDAIAAEYEKFNTEFQQIDPLQYPERLGGKDIRSNLQFAQEMSTRLVETLPATKPFLEKMPRLMGDAGTGDRTYLILFQNNKELRPSGGFLTSYALLKLREGNVADVQSADVYELDKAIGFETPPNPILQKYLSVDHWFVRDANLSPDYVVSADKFHEFWKKIPGLPVVDGIFAIDTEVPQRLLEALGPVTVPGYEEEFTSENVIQIMNDRARELREQPGRKALIGEIMTQLETKIFDAPQEKWGPLMGAVLGMLYEKHILVYTFDPEVQSFFDAFNVSGRVQNASHDYLYVNDANFAGGKANFFMEHDIEKTVREENGKFISTLKINYHNTGEYEKEVNPGYRSYVRVLVPKGSRLLRQVGSNEPVTTEEDLGKTVFVAFNITLPKETSQLEFEYELPDGIVQKDRYELLIQRQPGKPVDHYSIKAFEKEKQLDLLSDTRVVL